MDCSRISLRSNRFSSFFCRRRATSTVWPSCVMSPKEENNFLTNSQKKFLSKTLSAEKNCTTNSD